MTQKQLDEFQNCFDIIGRLNGSFCTILRPKKNMFVSCLINYFIYFFGKRDFVDKIGGKSGFQKKKMVKNCENSVFRVIFVK